MAKKYFKKDRPKNTIRILFHSFSKLNNETKVCLAIPARLLRNANVLNFFCNSSLINENLHLINNACFFKDIGPYYQKNANVISENFFSEL